MINIGDIYKGHEKSYDGYYVLIGHGRTGNLRFYEFIDLSELSRFDTSKGFDDSISDVFNKSEFRDCFTKSKKKVDKLLIETLLICTMGIGYYGCYE